MAAGHRETTIPVQSGALQALIRGPTADGAPTVVFAHGSGSSRHSPRNQHVAQALNAKGLRTILLDLLTPEEERVDLETREHRFDIPLLGARVAEVIDWALREIGEGASIGVFGASTGAAAALVAAAKRPDSVGAVVSRGGRPDLAGQSLRRVQAPTLLIVGERDLTVLDLNRSAQRELRPVQSELAIVEGATHLFEEPGALDQVSELAADWFTTHLLADQRPHGPARSN
ncbi:MAG: alpha/beta fold hydrolase [Actinobacteria bacterium]|nr:MAG: alpha/beta fold hydrolase [Actinomycetota bacterium]REK35740.1 MAG: alpha/beta fold hydrolase [Actinomycetota bacterium]